MQLMKWGLKPRSRKLIACMVALIMLLSMMGLGSPGTAQAKTGSSAPAESLVVNILNPDGTVTTVHEYVYDELASLEKINYYATIDSLPIGVGTKAQGVEIHTLINDAKNYNPDIKWESGQKLVFYATDYPTIPYQGTNYYTYDFLYGQNRCYFPKLVETYNPEYGRESIDLSGAVAVAPMLASSSYQDRGLTDAKLKSTDNPVVIDGVSSFRFCMGITEAEARDENFSSTNKFAKWVYRVDVGPVNGSKLIADKTDNEVGQPIEITFTDNSAWREKIAQVKVDENVLNLEQYAITAGKLTINSDVFTQAGDYTITVESPGYMNSTVKQTINGPPAYTVTFTVTDGTSAIQGANITIAKQTLTTDADGKATIDLEDGAYTYGVTAIGFITITDGSVTVNGAALAEAVTMTANPGGLTDAEKVAVAKANLTLGDINAVNADLTLPGNQNEATVTWTSGNTDVISNDGKVTRPAAGQPDACVTLTAIITAGEASDTKDFIVTVLAEEAAGSKTPPALAADTTDNKVGQAVDITFTDDATWCGVITGITVDGNALNNNQYSVTAGNINLIADIFTAPGDYAIAVQATDYADACVTQNILGVPRPGAWDGSIDTSWYNAAGKGFEISTPAELAGLATIVNGTADGISQDLFEGKTVILMADIDLGGIQNKDGTWDPASIQWTSIGGGEAGDSNNASFRGIFDGNGHIVSNIYIEVQNLDWQSDYEARNRGLFGLIWDSAVVKNIGVTGYVAGARSIAGVVGKNWGRIENCFNAATVIGTQSKGVGGITGANWDSPSIVNCYNIGSVLTKYGTGLAGGIAGDNEHIVSNCYNAGQISGTDSTNVGGIVGNIKGNNNPIVTDCYYDSALNAKGIGYIDSNNMGSYTIENVEGKTAEEMKTAAFIALLNGENGTAFVQDTSNINNGYPILAWQVAAPPARKTAPALAPDTTNNNLGQSIDITFTDDADWRGVISRIIVNDTTLTGEQYTVSAGNINIAASVFPTAGYYTITVPAAYYHDTTTITQTIEPGTLLTPPALNADSTENILGQAVDITFTDDETWRGAVYAITVNNTPLTSDQYILTTGNINIAAAVFTVPGDYEIVIQASGYNDAAVTQNIQGKTPPVLTADSVKTAVGQTVNITFNYNEKAWLEAITGITVNGMPLTEDQYTLIAGSKGTMSPYPEFPSKIKITGSVFTTPGDYEIVVRAGGYADAPVIQNKTPVLNADVTDNNIGNPIEITFTDNEPWRTGITAISVDGSDLAADKYTVAAGKIAITADVFTENRNYTVVIRTEGYYDAAVLQSIIVPQTMLPGNIYTIAGNGTAGYSGDGGAAVYAQLYRPNAATVDSHGNIYITDAYNHAIRKIDSNGIITTIAGDGTRGNNKPGSGSPSEGVPATEAPLSIPGNVAFDSAGNLYIADQYCPLR